MYRLSAKTYHYQLVFYLNLMHLYVFYSSFSGEGEHLWPGRWLKNQGWRLFCWRILIISLKMQNYRHISLPRRLPSVKNDYISSETSLTLSCTWIQET